MRKEFAFGCLLAVLQQVCDAGDPYDYKEIVKREVSPAAISRNASGRTLVDFGRAAVGWLEFRGVPSGAYEIVIGEMTNGCGVVTNAYPGSSICCQRLRGAVNDSCFRVPMPPGTLNLTGYDPKAPAILLPKWAGVASPFRFAEIVTLPMAAAPSNLVQVALNYPIDMTKSAFSCSDQDLVRLYDFCRYSVLATSFCGLYVDGDRERTPYEADAYLNQLCHYAIDDDYSLARKTHEWLMDHPTWPTEWKQHSVMIAWADWMWTGDARSLARFYSRLKSEKLMAGWKTRDDGLLVSSGRRARGTHDIIDWPVEERDGFVLTNVNSVVNGFHYLNLRQMADIARVLGRDEDAGEFDSAADKVKASYNAAFFDRKTGLYVDGVGVGHSSLHANAAALAFGLAEVSDMPRIADFLEQKGLACSVYFAQYLLEALYAAGRDEAALRMMLSDGDRSWLAMLAFGSTVTMEAWNPQAKDNLDLTHMWGGVPLNVISRYVLGVTPLEPGFRKISIRPRPAFLQHLSATVPTAVGPVRLTVDGRRLAVEVPAPAVVDWNGKRHELSGGQAIYE